MCSNAYWILQEILLLFPFVLLRYARAFLLIRQGVRCDFVRALAANFYWHCVQSSYRHLNYTEFINKLHLCSQICIVFNRLITFWNYYFIFWQVCWKFSRTGLDQLEYSNFAAVFNREKYFPFLNISHASYNTGTGIVQHISNVLPTRSGRPCAHCPALCLAALFRISATPYSSATCRQCLETCSRNSSKVVLRDKCVIHSRKRIVGRLYINFSEIRKTFNPLNTELNPTCQLYK